eukprot:5358976-Pleurochrysis_carterae.AAC.2
MGASTVLRATPNLDAQMSIYLAAATACAGCQKHFWATTQSDAPVRAQRSVCGARSLVEAGLDVFRPIRLLLVVL